MNGKQAKTLRRLVKAQFEDEVTRKVEKKIYKRTKTAWNKTPRNQRATLKNWLSTANNLHKSVTQK